MQRSETVHTDVGFITGIVQVYGPVTKEGGITVTVTAQSDTLQTTTTVQASQHGRAYCLVVTPGSWLVRAELGPVKSDSREAIVSNGEEFKINFHFGKAE
ncbi:MAG: hypothetical protein ACE145_03015 [Terriglobia bacterium]